MSTRKIVQDHELTWRFAATSDALTVFNWRNDPEVIRYTRSARPLEWKSHVEWMALHTADDYSSGLFLIFEVQEIPVATTRFEKIKESEGEISILVDPRFQGKGLGARVIQITTEQIESRFGGLELVAYIDKRNFPSVKFFQKAGFLLQSSPLPELLYFEYRKLV